MFCLTLLTQWRNQLGRNSYVQYQNGRVGTLVPDNWPDSMHSPARQTVISGTSVEKRLQALPIVAGFGGFPSEGPVSEYVSSEGPVIAQGVL